MKKLTVVDYRLREIHARSTGIPMSDLEIANALGGCLTRQRVGQIANGALLKIRKRLLKESPELKDFFK